MREEDLVEEYVSSVHQGGFEGFLRSEAAAQIQAKVVGPQFEGRISYFSGFVKHMS